jgi:hypothetical protein
MGQTMPSTFIFTLISPAANDGATEKNMKKARSMRTIFLFSVISTLLSRKPYCNSDGVQKVPFRNLKQEAKPEESSVILMQLFAINTIQHWNLKRRFHQSVVQEDVLDAGRQKDRVTA